MAERAVLAEIIGANDGRTTTASVGGALYPDHGRDAAAIMKQADLALFRAKARGRACAVISSRSAETA
jgi:GGDEF domain-containing protein